MVKNDYGNEGINSAFAELRQRVYENGLLHASPYFYTRRIAGMLMLLAASMVILTHAYGFWIQMVNAILLAFTFGQISFFIHDVGHGQVMNNRLRRYVNPFFSAVMGSSLDWWVQKHNQHHAYPNQEGRDPDILFDFLAFSEKQAREKRGFSKVMVRNQHFLFFPFLLFETLNLRRASIVYLFKQRSIASILDIFLIIGHLAVFILLLVIFLPIGTAIAFALLHWGALGVYLGTSFAPNHKGMPIIKPDIDSGFIEQQVSTSRNVRGGWFVDFWYGGLNYQIEHHLFPSMPRNRLKHAAVIVEKFCKERSIPYASVSIAESYRQIFGHFARIGNSV